MRYALLPSVIRLVAAACLATLGIFLHVHLARRARVDAPGHVPHAWAIPGAAALFAWRRGARTAPLAYGAAWMGYLLLRVLG